MLLFLHGETRIDEQRGVTFLTGTHESHETSHATHHRTDCWNTARRINIQIDESFYKAGSFRLELWSTVNVGVDGGHTVLKRFYLRINAYLAGRKARNTHFHTHELLATGVFDVVNQAFHFTDGGSAHLFDAAFGYDFVNNFCRDWSFFHHLYI